MYYGGVLSIKGMSFFRFHGIHMNSNKAINYKEFESYNL